MTLLEPYLTYAKIAAIVATAAALVTGGYHFGGLSKAKDLAQYKAQVAGEHVTQLQAVVDTMGQHDREAAARAVKQQGVIGELQDELLKPPPTAGFVERMRVVQAASCATGDSHVPSAGAVAGAAAPAGGIPGGDAEGDRLLQSALDAAARDAARLNAMRQLAPQLLP